MDEMTPACPEGEPTPLASYLSITVTRELGSLRSSVELFADAPTEEAFRGALSALQGLTERTRVNVTGMNATQLSALIHNGDDN